MNGRVYDYNVGRFLSVDPFIKDAGNSQAINPYSYVLNNPLSFTDPTGYLYEPGDRGAAAGLAVSVATGLTSEQDARTLEAVDAASPFGGGLAGSTDLGVGVKEFLATLAITGSVTVASEVLSNVDLSKRRRGNNGARRSGTSNASSDIETADIESTTKTANTRPAQTFHRRESTTQTPEVARLQQESGELHGDIPQNGIETTPQAFKGPLKEGQRGIEFTTTADASGNPPKGFQNFRGADVERFERADGKEMAKINIEVTKNTQTERRVQNVGPPNNTSERRGRNKFQSNRIGTRLIKKE
jgi:hypothetical protein